MQQSHKAKLNLIHTQNQKPKKIITNIFVEILNHKSVKKSVNRHFPGMKSSLPNGVMDEWRQITPLLTLTLKRGD
jgi:hypothetical protein